MSYVTFEEFQKLTSLNDFEETNFNKWIVKASAVLDNLTNSFYYFHDLEMDKVLFRKERFKQALCAQIIYFNELGSDTYEGINSTPQSNTIGSTTVSSGSRYDSSGKAESKELVANDVYIYLEGTGLLYRGVKSC